MIRLLIIISSLLFSLSVNAQIALALKPFPEQCRLFDSMRNEFIKAGIDSFRKNIEPYIEQAITNDDEALEIFLRIQLLDDINKAGGDDDKEFERQLKLLRIKSEQKKYPYLTAICYDIYSRYYKRKDQLNDALKYALLSYELYSTMDTFNYKQLYLMHLAHLYYDYRDYESALKYLHQGRADSDDENLGLLNSIALANDQLERFDSALYYYDLLYKASKKADDLFWQDIALNNAVSIYLHREMYDTVLNVLLRSYDETKNSTGQYRMRANTCRLIGYTYYKLKNLKLADTYCAKALSLYQHTGNTWYFKRPDLAISIYGDCSKIKLGLKDYKMAYYYSDTLNIVADSFNKKANLAQMKSIENRLEKVRSENANQELKYEQTQTKMQRNLLIVGIIAATFIVLYISNRYKVRQQKLEEEKNVADFMLKRSEDKLSAFTSSISEKNKLLENLQKKLTSYESDEKTIEYANAISELRDSTILTDDDWVDFRKNFERTYPGFLSRLEDNYPTLSQAEYRYILLAKMNMSTKEMASVLGVTAGSVRTTKSRLMRKIGLENEDDLKNMIRSL